MSHGQRLGHVALPRRARAGDLVRTERADGNDAARSRSEEHTSELQSLRHLVCRLLLEKKKNKHRAHAAWQALGRPLWASKIGLPVEFDDRVHGWFHHAKYATLGTIAGRLVLQDSCCAQ